MKGHGLRTNSRALSKSPMRTVMGGAMMTAGVRLNPGDVGASSLCVVRRSSPRRSGHDAQLFKSNYGGVQPRMDRRQPGGNSHGRNAA